MIEITTTGGELILRRMQSVADAQTMIARRAVGAGVGVLAQACRDAAPGSTKQEVGGYVRSGNSSAQGVAGLRKWPRRVPYPQRWNHLLFLTRGTKFITPRRYVENALAASRPAAIAAIEQAVWRTVENAAISIS